MLWGDEENERRWREAVEQQKRAEGIGYGAPSGDGKGGGCLPAILFLLLKIW